MKRVKTVKRYEKQGKTSNKINEEQEMKDFL